MSEKDQLLESIYEFQEVLLEAQNNRRSRLDNMMGMAKKGRNTAERFFKRGKRAVSNRFGKDEKMSFGKKAAIGAGAGLAVAGGAGLAAKFGGRGLAKMGSMAKKRSIGNLQAKGKRGIAGKIADRFNK